MPPFKLPTIELDTTLAQFYKEENKKTGDKITIVAAYPAGLRVDNQKYVYHDEDRPESSELPEGVTDAERAGAGEVMRALGAQKFSFCVGKMLVIIFDASCKAKVPSYRNSVVENLEILADGQYPWPLFATSPSWIGSLIKADTVKLATRLPLDGMEHLPHTLHPDIHYELLSKRGLAVAKEHFATPESLLLDLKIDWHLWEEGNSAAVEERIKLWMEEVLTAAQDRPVPFVLKLQQTTFGKGTYIVKTEEARNALLSELQGLLDYNASRTTKFNQHLHPATIVITDFVDCPEGGYPSYALTFWVRRDGTYIFINCCEQTLSAHYTWDGSAITFSKQEHFSKYFAKTISDVTSYLHTKGYYGCVGIDVLEDKQGKQWVVDMNVRPPGSLILGLLKNFLAVERGFDDASLLSAIRTKKTKEEFMAKLEKEFMEGRLIMIAWYEDTPNEVSWTSLIVAGETKEEVRKLVERLDGL